MKTREGRGAEGGRERWDGSGEGGGARSWLKAAKVPASRKRPPPWPVQLTRFKAKGSHHASQRTTPCNANLLTRFCRWTKSPKLECCSCSILWSILPRRLLSALEVVLKAMETRRGREDIWMDRCAREYGPRAGMLRASGEPGALRPSF